jgi:hypothetical protein
MVGDPAQLLPVGDDMSNALDENYYKQKLLKVTGITLTTIFRQIGESKIVENAKKIRENIENQNYYEYRIETGNDIQEVSFSEAISSFIYNQSENLNSIIITYSNSLALDYNMLVRKALKINEKVLTKGEKLIVNQNYYSKNGDLLNGQQIIVHKLIDGIIEKQIKILNANKDHIISLKYQKALIKDIDTESVFECLILLNVLESDQRSLNAMEKRAQFIEWKKRNPKVPESSTHFAKLLIEDIFFNALHVKYGYAITCHKSQGGEWPHVIVDFTDRGNPNEETLRWSYTAITRAKKILTVINNPNRKITDLFSKNITKAEPKIPTINSDELIMVKNKAFNDLPEGQILKWNSILNNFKNFNFISFRKFSEYHQRLELTLNNQKYTINQYFKKNNIPGDTDIDPPYEIDYEELNLNSISIQPQTLYDSLMMIFSLLKSNKVKIIGIQPEIFNHHVICILSTSVVGSYLKIFFDKNYSLTTILPFSELGMSDNELVSFLQSLE